VLKFVVIPMTMNFWLVSISCILFLCFLLFLQWYCFNESIILPNLADVIGLMTGISAEREYIRDGKITKMVIVELTDARYILIAYSYFLCSCCCFIV
jgi:hypothetical protein